MIDVDYVPVQISSKVKARKKTRKMGKKGHARSLQDAIQTLPNDALQRLFSETCSVISRRAGGEPKDLGLASASHSFKVSDIDIARILLHSMSRPGQASVTSFSCMRDHNHSDDFVEKAKLAAFYALGWFMISYFALLAVAHSLSPSSSGRLSI